MCQSFFLDKPQYEQEILILVMPNVPTEKLMECSAARGVQSVKRNVPFCITVAIATSETKTSFKDQVVAMAERSPNQIMASKEASKEMMQVTKTAKQDIIEQLKYEVISAHKTLRNAQTQYEKHFDACLRRTTKNVLCRDFVLLNKIFSS